MFGSPGTPATEVNRFPTGPTYRYRSWPYDSAARAGRAAAAVGCCGRRWAASGSGAPKTATSPAMKRLAWNRALRIMATPPLGTLWLGSGRICRTGREAARGERVMGTRVHCAKGQAAHDYSHADSPRRG